MSDQRAIDDTLLLDGTENKSRLGANVLESSAAARTRCTLKGYRFGRASEANQPRSSRPDDEYH